ncbi:3'-5' exonuclease [Streptomyces stelliscabiei]|uniref:Inhibitor of KinA sporulation pathway (Predicted exonuclease) n=1 Tax=Streptomyces stelliscabiei TaxID=146820 RepID=A0A8I0P7S5_9ACTN|nr:3'-5' exonuclease [Streptomyces stelliscabiei]KND43959.1 exonuclease [Streptomyces stelliscabiei]MBE1598704.1 inhibitor of KinA sporulation pathway (predicted exonuclease) [Streptomyces stelliscabiei]MDX2516505.1 exonuclease domain-containing protein [Streptomyces stelliscabiei]MDX2553613.1 exonuclease domain-containing protein [Streptomyces stelliscabiei]MDX2613411.1 exonuclease domain-containing protein [Streptomyces stelliscabiei]
MPTFVIFDLEFTTWPGAMEQHWSAPGQLREIVQIGALRLNEEYSVVERYDALVRPVVNPVLSPFLTALTGIEQGAVDRDGLAPARALSDFLAFCRGQSVLSYGNDMLVLGENIGWARARGEEIEHNALTPGFVNIRPWLNAAAPATAGVNSGRLWQALGLPRPATPGDEHSALFDCHSIATALRHLAGTGAALPDALLHGG